MATRLSMEIWASCEYGKGAVLAFKASVSLSAIHLCVDVRASHQKFL